MPNLYVTGLLYPAKEDANAGERNKRTRRQTLDEFTVDEIDELVRELKGVPLCLKHDMNLVIGVVVSAEKTLADGVFITVFIDGSTQLGADSVAKVNNGYYRALSLGHEWIVDDITGEYWKQPLEVTLCKKPRRRSCMLHGKTDAGFDSDDISGDINTGVVVHERYRSTIDCEFNRVEMESENAPTAMDAEMAPPVEPQPEPEVVPETETGSLNDQAETLRILEETNNLMNQKDRQLEESLARSAQLQSALAEKEKLIAEREEQQKKEMADLMKKQKDMEAEVKKADLQQKKNAQERINSLRAELAARVQKTKLPDPPASQNPIEQLQYTEAVLAAAIKEDDMNKRERKNMERQAQHLQQENKTIGDTLDQFGRPSAPLRGMMKASVDDEDEDAQPRAKKVNRESLVQIYRNNVGKMSMRDLEEVAYRLQSESSTRGIYNASADDMQTDEPCEKIAISGFDLYPERYKQLADSFTGLGYEPKKIIEWQQGMYWSDPRKSQYFEDLKMHRQRYGR